MDTNSVSPKSSSFAIYGTFIHALSCSQPMVKLENTVMLIRGGCISALHENVSREFAENLALTNQVELKAVVDGSFVMPGMVDAHIHASQYVNLGIGYSETLLDWLNKYTFSVESKFSDLEFARDVYEKVVRRTLSHGTTTASYFATIHKDATLILADVMHRYGQRGFVGKVNMDKNSPGYYIETTEQSLMDTRQFIEEMRHRYGKDGLLSPCVTPRFSVTCTAELLEGLAAVAKEYDVPIQTHMSENKDEIDYVLSNSQVDEYIHVYEKAGMLSSRTMFAHCVHSGDVELDILKKYECGIVHCPNSNTSIRSGTMDIRKVESFDIKLGLGTDVSGGYSLSILDSVRKSMEISKLLSCIKSGPYQYIDHHNAFYLATLGGARVMNLDHRVGSFAVGKEFDALVINPDSKCSSFDTFAMNSFEDRVEKFLYCGDDRNIEEIYVAGRLIELSRM